MQCLQNKLAYFCKGHRQLVRNVNQIKINRTKIFLNSARSLLVHETAMAFDKLGRFLQARNTNRRERQAQDHNKVACFVKN